MRNLDQGNSIAHLTFNFWIAVNAFSAVLPITTALACQVGDAGEHSTSPTGERVHTTGDSNRDPQSIKKSDTDSDVTNPWPTSYYIRNAEIISGDRKTETPGEIGGLISIGAEAFVHITPESDRDELHQRHSRYSLRFLRTTNDRIDLLCRNAQGEYFRVSFTRHDGKHYVFVSHLLIEVRNQVLSGPTINQLTWRLEVDPFPPDHFSSIMRDAEINVVFGGKLDSESPMFTGVK